MTSEPNIIDCPKCAGHGLVKAKYNKRLMVYECPKCKGWGWVEDAAALEPKP